MLDIAPVLAFEDEPTAEGYWISSAWLESWVSAETTVMPIDNTGLLCCHTTADGSACMDPNKTTSAKRISQGAWTCLQV